MAGRSSWSASLHALRQCLAARKFPHLRSVIFCLEDAVREEDVPWARRGEVTGYSAEIVEDAVLTLSGADLVQADFETDAEEAAVLGRLLNTLFVGVLHRGPADPHAFAADLLRWVERALADRRR